MKLVVEMRRLSPRLVVEGGRYKRDVLFKTHSEVQAPILNLFKRNYMSGNVLEALKAY